MVNRLGVWDYVIIVIVLLFSSLIGLYYRFTGGKQRTMKEYIFADKNMSIIPVAFSLVASYISAVTMLGSPSESYLHGIEYAIIYVCPLFVVPIAAYLYLPVFFKLQATSAYEYLEKRFGRASRLMASIIYTVQMVMYTSVALYAPAISLETLIGLNRTVAILSVGLVCTFYSTIGGIKAVLMTDVFQSLLMFAALFSIIICAHIETGSFTEIWRIAERGNRTNILNFNPDPTTRHSWFSLLIGGTVTYLAIFGTNQVMVQRYLTVKDVKTAQKTIWASWPLFTIIHLGTLFCGLAIYAKYFNCDPLSANYITSSDQLLPYYVVDVMGHIPAMSGLFAAGIFSGCLSTISSTLNSLAAITVEDYYKLIYEKLQKRPSSEKRNAVVTKIVSLALGIICIGMAFLAQFLGSVLQVSVTINGIVGGPLFGLFTLGMCTPRSNQKGALTGFVAGLACGFWSAFGQPRPVADVLPLTTEGCTANNHTIFPDRIIVTSPIHMEDLNQTKQYFWLYKVSYLYNGVIGLLITLIVGYLVSCLTAKLFREPTQRLDPDLFFPPVSRRLKKLWTKPVKLRGLSNLDKKLKNNAEKEVLTGDK